MKLVHTQGTKVNLFIVNQLNKYNPKYVVKMNQWVHLAVMQDGMLMYYPGDKAALPIVTKSCKEFFNIPAGGRHAFIDMEMFQSLINENTIKIKNVRSIE